MIEIGRKYEIVNSLAGNNGKIVTVTGYAGFDVDGLSRVEGQRWFIDTWMSTTNVNLIINHAGENNLKPIYDGNEPISWEDMKGIWVPAREGMKI